MELINNDIPLNVKHPSPFQESSNKIKWIYIFAEVYHDDDKKNGKKKRKVERAIVNKMFFFIHQPSSPSFLPLKLHSTKRGTMSPTPGSE